MKNGARSTPYFFPSKLPTDIGSLSLAQTTSSIWSHTPRALSSSSAWAHFAQGSPLESSFLTMIILRMGTRTRAENLGTARRKVKPASAREDHALEPEFIVQVRQEMRAPPHRQSGATQPAGDADAM